MQRQAQLHLQVRKPESKVHVPSFSRQSTLACDRHPSSLGPHSPLLPGLAPPNSKQRRRGALAASLALNVALLLIMLYRTQQGVPSASSDGDAAQAAPQLQQDGGGGSSKGSDAEAMLEGLHQDARALLSQVAGGAPGAGGAAAAAAPPPPPKYWLTVGIPTVPRKVANTTYLTTTLESLLDELPADPSELLYGRVRVLVMNNAADHRHPEFQELRRRAQEARPGDRFAAKAAVYVEFLDNPGTVTDPAPDLPDPDDLNNPGDRPGRQVRKQTCDLVTLLRLAAPLSTYYLFMEDDFRVCPFALRALQYALSKANALGHLAHWLALRVSYGMNGVLMRNEDLPALTDFLWKYVTEQPPDLLWVDYLQRQPLPGTEQYEQYAGGALDRSAHAVPMKLRRPFVVYKYNLMAHLGTVSSFAVRPDRPAWPGCFERMNKVWSLQMYERFMARCRHTDLSPCLYKAQGPAAAAERWLQLPLDWAVASSQLPPVANLTAAGKAALLMRNLTAASAGGAARGATKAPGTVQKLPAAGLA